jgi:hypothetical protein
MLYQGYATSSGRDPIVLQKQHEIICRGRTEPEGILSELRLGHWGPSPSFIWNFPAKRLLFHQSPFRLMVSQNSGAGRTRGLTAPMACIARPFRKGEIQS